LCGPLLKDKAECLDSLTKKCGKCRQDKPIEAFHLCSKAPDGRQYWCITCRAGYDNARRLEPLGTGPLEPEIVCKLLSWKPPIVSITWTSPLCMEATGT
jgi:hypothetical protein